MSSGVVEEQKDSAGMRKRDAKAQRKMITKTVQEEYVSDKNIEIVVRDTENMNEYVARVAFDEQYLAKLVEWVHKSRYSLVESAMEDHITLKVDIFTFSLQLRNVSDEMAARSLLHELKRVKTEREQLLKDIKLFNYFFFNVFNESDFRGRSSNMLPKVPQAQIEKYIENPESLYVIKQAVAVASPQQ